MNLDPIRRAYDYFKARGDDAIDMGDWLQFRVVDEREDDDSEGYTCDVSSDDIVDVLKDIDDEQVYVCGTICCIAGAMWLTRPGRHNYDSDGTEGARRTIAEMRNDTRSIAQRAQDELGVSERAADLLFNKSRWPGEFRDRYATDGPRAAVLALLDAILVEDLVILGDDGWHGPRSNCTCPLCLKETSDV